jgi:hypothetical protein|nr:MAG TPA: hypothetical protein [Caudoviricetes sp.]
MPKRRKRLTAVEKEYRRIRKNLQSWVRAENRRGFIYDTEKLIPKIPKKVTRGSINRLKKLTPEKRRSYATAYVDFNTGEIFTPKEGRKRYRKDRELYRQTGNMDEFASGPYSSNIILENFYDLISSYVYGRWDRRKTDRRDMAKSWIDRIVNTYGADAAAKMLEEGKRKGNWLSAKEAYDTIRLQASLNEMLTYLKVPENEKRSFMENEFYDEE